MAIGNFGPGSEIFSAVLTSGRDARNRQDHPVDGGSEAGGQAGPADGNFLGNIHQGAGSNPEAIASESLAVEGGTSANGTGGFEIPAAGVLVELPLIPTFAGYGISVEVSGVPETTTFSSGRSLGAGRWSLDLSDLDGLRLQPAGGADSAELPGPLALDVSVAVTDSSTGEVKIVPGEPIQLGPIQLGPVSAIADTDDAANTIAENPSDGASVPITAGASDPDYYDVVTFSLTDDAGGRFVIDPKTGEVTVADASLLDYETAPEHVITVQAVSTDGSSTVQQFTISLIDDNTEFRVTAISDADTAANRVSESAADGSVVGITAFADDADGSDTVTYTLLDDAGGRFTVDPDTGVVTVADASLLDYESATRHTIRVQATSTDGSARTKNFSIRLDDDKTEFAVSEISDTNAAPDTVSESAIKGDVVGITAFADDADGSDNVRYSLTENPGGLFKINAKTGEITVNRPDRLDFETVQAHTITVQAKSPDGSTSTKEFTISLTDDTSEFAVSAVTDANPEAETLSESVADGTLVGITAFASDADATDTVSYSLADNAGGRFIIDPTTGAVRVADASLLDFETAQSHTITVLAASTDGSTSQQDYTISLTDDATEFAVSSVSDADAAADTVSEAASVGDVVGITAFASDGDATDTVTYSLTDDAGGRFAIDPATGVITVADPSLLDFETATGHDISVLATSTDGSTEAKTFTIGLVDDTGEFAISAVSDADAAANTVSESASVGDVVGITAFASDADGSDTITYGLTDDAGGRFAIDPATGVITVADPSLLDFETLTSHTITVQAASSDGSTETKQFAIGLTDDTAEFAVTAVSDTNTAADTVSESASVGDVVGITAFASDGDATDTVTYSLTDDAGGRFAIDPATGVVTVADPSLLDFETLTSHTITVQAASSDGSTETKQFAIGLSDDASEFTVSAISDTNAAADTISESASAGAVVGITAFASDADGSDTVSYSLTDDAGGRFAIDPATGVVTVADPTALDFETLQSHTISVLATSTDGSTQTKQFTIGLTDDAGEFSVSPVTDTNIAANTVSEGAANGDTVGITASALDLDVTDSVTYSLADDAGGIFAVDPSTGAVTVADASQLDYETAQSHSITVQATSTDGSTSSETFSIAVTDINEAPTGASVGGPVLPGGAVLHLDATDVDADGNAGNNPANGAQVSNWDDSSGSNLDAVQQSAAPVVASGAINGKDAIDFSGADDALHVADSSAINLAAHEERSHAIAFQTGDDVSGFQVIYEEGANIRGYSLSIAGDPANGDQPTLWAFVYNNQEWAAGDQYKAINLGPVEANETYNVVMVHDASAADLADRTFTAYVNGDYQGTLTSVDVQQSHSGDIGVGGYLDMTVNPVTNALHSDDGGEFSGLVGEVMIWNDALTEQQISETSSYLNQKWSGAPSVGENVPDGTAVFAVGDIIDEDSVDSYTFALLDDADGRFAIDSTTGVVTVADTSLLDYETTQDHTVTVRITDAGGNTLDVPVTVQVADGNDGGVSVVSDTDAAADTVSEGASDGDAVGVTAFASDTGDTVSYSLTDDAGGRFAIDSATGEVTVADASLLDYETAQSHTITVQASSSDGSTQIQTFSIGISDDTSEFTVSAVVDSDATANAVSEGASDGDVVGVTAFASDGDGTDSVSYSLTDDAGGRFAIDPSTGQVTVADASLLDFETAQSHSITVQATSSDGSVQSQTFSIGIRDDTSEFTVSAVSDTDATANTVSEGASDGAVVGVTAFASDSDGSDSVSYSLTDDAGGRFAIDPSTGQVTVADASLLDFETAQSHSITVQSTSTDGSTQTQSFSIGVSDDTGEFTVSGVTDTDATANAVSEGASDGAVVGVTAFASDGDGSDSVSYSLTNDASGRFAIDPATGQVTVGDASLLDFETAQSHLITVQATSTDGSTQAQTFSVGISDDTSEFTVSAVSDTDATADAVSEGASDGAVVGVTAFASDGDGTDSVSYGLTDDAGGRFAIDPTTGQVTVADASLLDFETAQSHTITVQATSTDGSTQTQAFSIGVSDDTGEFSVSTVSDTDATANSVSEGASDGAIVGVTAFASDGDGSDSVSYSLADDAGGRFAIDPTTGQVTVADASLLNFETAQSHSITVQATSTDGSIQTRTFSIGVSDDTGEFTVSAVSDADATANTVSEGASDGAIVGVTAFASDADGTDSISYSLTDDAGGRFAIDPASGEVTVADASLLDFETAQSHSITVLATSTDGSVQSQAFSIAVSDDTSEFAVSAVSDTDGGANTIAENASNGDVVGITGFASDGDGSDSVSYSLTDDAGGRFAIDSSTGDVTVADASLLDFETAQSHSVTVQATSTDGSVQSQQFSIAVTDANDAPTDLTLNNGDTYGDAVEAHSPVGYWRLADNHGAATAADSMGSHDGGYAQGANATNDDGPFAGIDNTAAVFDGSNDYVEIPASADFTLPQGTVQAWFKVDAFGGGDQTIFSMDSSGTDTGGVYLAVDSARHDLEFFIEDASAPVSFGETNSHYMLSGNNSITAGQWHHVAVSFGPGGMVMYLDGAQVATNAYTGGIGNVDNEPITIGASQRNAATEGQAVAGELDRFFDGQIAEVALYDTALSAVDVTALGNSGINGYDIPGDTVTENAENGTVVGLVEASDPDSAETFTYSLADDVGGRFAIDSSTGLVTVADGSLLDYETAMSHTLTVQVTDSGGLSYTEDFTVNLVNVSELTGPGIVVGTEAADEIVGTDLSEGRGGEEILLGMGGDDTISGLGNEDRLVGGEGDDTLSGGSGGDIIIGGAGDDVADGGSGDDIFVFQMGDGNDTVTGGTGTDTIMLMGADGGVPDPSDWSLNLSTGSASWSTNEVSLSSDATGTITYSDGSSVAFDGVERIDFSGSVSTDGGKSDVTLADAGGDTIVGSNDEDTILGSSSADSLSGGRNEDLLIGGDGGDALYGGDGDDALLGEAGSDALYGERGDDTLVGGSGDDALYGGDGDDTLVGGLGDDAAYGGAGDDTFVFGAGWGDDSFDGGGGSWTDTIQLSGKEGLTAYNGWTVSGADITDSGDGFLELADDSDGTITLDDGSELAFTDVDRIEW